MIAKKTRDDKFSIYIQMESISFISVITLFPMKNGQYEWNMSII